MFFSRFVTILLCLIFPVILLINIFAFYYSGETSYRGLSYLYEYFQRSYGGFGYTKYVLYEAQSLATNFSTSTGSWFVDMLVTVRNILKCIILPVKLLIFFVVDLCTNLFYILGALGSIFNPA